MKKHIKILIIIVSCLVCAGLLGASALLLANGHVKRSTADQILAPEQAAALEDVDCILVLGCLVKADGTPSDMLYDRISVGVTLYQNGTSQKLLMSGDHGQKEYDEVNTMKTCAIDAGVPSEDVFMDHAGFSTYESVFRAKEIFGAKKIVIVTQEYHLHRALYVANALGMEAYGVSADLRGYSGQTKRDVREILARIKDMGYSLFKPAPTYLGDPISLDQSGDITNDQ
jgi:vancomycin permeability regulator SanA